MFRAGRGGRTGAGPRSEPDDPFLARSFTLPIRRVPLTGQQKRILILVAIALLLAVIGGVAGTRLLTRPRKVRRSVQADLRVLRERYRATLTCLSGRRVRSDGRNLVARLTGQAVSQPRWPEVLARCRRLATRLAVATEGVASASDAVSDRVPSSIRSKYHEARVAAWALLEATTRIADQAIAGHRLPPPDAAKSAGLAAARYGQRLDQIASLAGLPSKEDSATSDLPRAPAYARPGPLPGLLATKPPLALSGLEPALSTPHPFRGRAGVLLRSTKTTASSAPPRLLDVSVTGEARWLRPAIPAPPPGVTPGAVHFLALSRSPTWPMPRPGAKPLTTPPGPNAKRCATPLLWARSLWSSRLGRGDLQVGISCAAENASSPRPARASVRSRAPAVRPRAPAVHPRVPATRSRAHALRSRAHALRSRAHALRSRAHASPHSRPGRADLRSSVGSHSIPSRRETRHWTLRYPRAVGVALRPEGGVLVSDGSAWILASVPAGLGRTLLRFRLLPAGRWAPPQVLATGLAADPRISIWPLEQKAPMGARPKTTHRARPVHAISARDREGSLRILLVDAKGARGRTRLPIRGALRSLCGDSARLYALDAVGTLWSVHGAKATPTRLWSAGPTRRDLRMACLADRAAVAWRSRSPGWPGAEASHPRARRGPHPPRPQAGPRRADPRPRLPGYMVCGPTGCSKPISTSWSRISSFSLLPCKEGIALLLAGPDALLLRRDPHARGLLAPPHLITAWRAPPRRLYAAARSQSGQMLLVFEEAGDIPGPDRPPKPTPATRRILALVTHDAGAHWETP